nr:hypothetical protein [Tanacetum cinerariifolium]
MQVNNGRKKPVVNTISDEACTEVINDICDRGRGDSDKNKKEFNANDINFPSLNEANMQNSADSSSMGLYMGDEACSDNGKAENVECCGKNGMYDDLTPQVQCDVNCNVNNVTNKECNMDKTTHKSYANVTKPKANENDNKLSLIPMCVKEEREIMTTLPRSENDPGRLVATPELLTGNGIDGVCTSIVVEQLARWFFDVRQGLPFVQLACRDLPPEVLLALSITLSNSCTSNLSSLSELFLSLNKSSLVVLNSLMNALISHVLVFLHQ